MPADKSDAQRRQLLPAGSFNSADPIERIVKVIVPHRNSGLRNSITPRLWLFAKYRTKS